MGINDRGTRTKSSWSGSAVSLLIIIGLAYFCLYKFGIVLDRKGQQMMQTVKDNFISEHEKFSTDRGFAIAFGLVNDNRDLAELTPDIGTLELIAMEWGTREGEDYFYEENLVETHPCTAEELGLEGSDSVFFPVVEQQVDEVQSMLEQSAFLCLNKEDMFIHGHYNSDNARNFYIFIKKCIGEDCADEETIQKYFAGTYVNLLSNYIRFDYRQFGGSSIIRESKTFWTAVQTQIQTEMPFKVTRTEVQLQDQVFNFDDLTQLQDDSVFILKQQQARPFEMYDDMVMAVSIEVDPDMNVLTRNNYTVLDVLSDVGGLAEVLWFVSSLFLGLLNYNHLTSYLTSKLFKAEYDEDPKNETYIRPTKFLNLKEFLFDSLPTKWVHCCIDRRTESVLEGWRQLRKEKDIVRILRSLRYMRKAIRLLITDRTKRKQLKRESEFKILKPSQTSIKDKKVYDEMEQEFRTVTTNKTVQPVLHTDQVIISDMLNDTDMNFMQGQDLYLSAGTNPFKRRPRTIVEGLGQPRSRKKGE